MDNRYSESLILPEDSKFEGIGFDLPAGAVNDFFDLLNKIAGDSQNKIESFQIAFGGHGQSSNFSWAISDLKSNMQERANDAAFFLDSLWAALGKSEKSGSPVPSYLTINRILENNQISLSITDDRKLVKTNIDTITVEAHEYVSTTEEHVNALHKGEQLGAGGYGVVFKATRSTSVSDFEFALKLLDPSPFVSDRSKAIDRFKREVKAIQKLDHRAIIPYIEAGVTNLNNPYILMPLISGVDIRTKCGQSDMNQIILLFTEILDGLSHAHENQVLHRDLKPANILVRNTDRQPIILDFGAAYLLDELSPSTLTTAAVGTIGYIPSEVLADPKKRNCLQDIYACGVMLYEAVLGHRPDPANYRSIGSLRPEINWIDPIIEDAIAGEKLRMTSAKEFSERLKR